MKFHLHSAVQISKWLALRHIHSTNIFHFPNVSISFFFQISNSGFILGVHTKPRNQGITQIRPAVWKRKNLEKKPPTKWDRFYFRGRKNRTFCNRDLILLILKGITAAKVLAGVRVADCLILLLKCGCSVFTNNKMVRSLMNTSCHSISHYALIVVDSLFILSYFHIQTI